MTEYHSDYTGKKIDDAVKTVINNDCQIKWGHILGSPDISAQRDLNNTFVHKTGGDPETISGSKTFEDASTFNGITIFNDNVSLNGTTTAVTPAANDSSTKVPTTAWVTNAIATSDSSVVHIGGTETVTGAKTFNNTVAFNNNVTFSSGKTVDLQGTSTAVTPAASDNSTKIATTEWIRLTGNGIVHIDKTETISGIKIFSNNTTFNSEVTLNGNCNFNNNVTFSSGKTVALQGTSTAVTPSANDNSTKIATTEWVASKFVDFLSSLYPKGSIYLTTSNSSVCPLQTLGVGTWTRVGEGYALWTGNGSNGASTIAAGLPEVYGGFNFSGTDSWANASGGFASWMSQGAGQYHHSDKKATANFNLYASRCSSVYGSSSTVQPPAYVVNVWRRTA